MNAFLDSRFIEVTHRLALGLEPLDAVRGGRIAHPLSVAAAETFVGLKRPNVVHHDSCLHAVLYEPGIPNAINLRFWEKARRFVARQIRYPILPLAQAEAQSFRVRVRRPRLFPGAAYDAVSLITGIRGRAERGGKPVRWCRVEARPDNGGAVLARAQGDDRGEFLLLLPPAAATGADLEDPLGIEITVLGPTVAPVPPSADLPSQDPMWDLPTEIAPAADPFFPESDSVSAGVDLPAGYTSTATRSVNVPLGTIFSVRSAFVIP